MNSVSSSDNSRKNVMQFKIDLRWVVLALLALVLLMLALWRPWEAEPGNDARTVSVTGNATITATPDEFVFNPTYEFKNADKSVALKELTAKQVEVIDGLKKTGVSDDKIKTDSSGYDSSYYDETSKAYSYTLALNVTVSDKVLSQKVQDYLVSTDPTGAVSPYASFSKETQRKLEAQARDQATKEARAKADQSANNLGFKVGKVKSVDDGGFGGVDPCRGGGICPMMARGTITDSNEKTTSLAVQPGQNDLEYSVTVVYYVR